MNGAPSPARPADLDLPPELSLYRDRTLALLRRYQRLSVEVGRLPSLVGREFFRAKVTSYRQVTFEDAVVFVHDIERCLERLDPISRMLLARIALMEYSRDEVAAQLGCHRHTVYFRFDDAVDLLTQEFLACGILRGRRRRSQAARRRRSDSVIASLHAAAGKTCQDPKTVENSASNTIEKKYFLTVNRTLSPSDVLCLN